MNFPKPKLIISDFDGTMTHGHRITDEFPKILEICSKENIPFIVHTGRSISWAHFFATHYEEIPFAIAEGGGVYCYRADRGLLAETFMVSEAERKRLAQATATLLEKFPGLELSKDSLGRSTDRAIELRDLEDPALVEKVKKYFDENNVNYSQSNVHLNFWCGDVDKYKGLLFFLKNEFPEVALDEIWYFGDSMNDAPMFAELKYTVGVSNIDQVLDKMDKHPSVILKGKENEGPSGVLQFLKDKL